MSDRNVPDVWVGLHEGYESINSPTFQDSHYVGDSQKVCRATLESLNTGRQSKPKISVSHALLCYANTVWLQVTNKLLMNIKSRLESR